MNNICDFILKCGNQSSKAAAFGAVVGSGIGLMSKICDGGDRAVAEATRLGSIGGTVGSLVGGSASVLNSTRKVLLKQRDEFRKQCKQNSLNDKNHLCLACSTLPNELKILNNKRS